VDPDLCPIQYVSITILIYFGKIPQYTVNSRLSGIRVSEKLAPFNVRVAFDVCTRSDRDDCLTDVKRVSYCDVIDCMFKKKFMQATKRFINDLNAYHELRLRVWSAPEVDIMMSPGFIILINK